MLPASQQVTDFIDVRHLPGPYVPYIFRVLSLPANFQPRTCYIHFGFMVSVAPERCRSPSIYILLKPQHFVNCHFSLWMLVDANASLRRSTEQTKTSDLNDFSKEIQQFYWRFSRFCIFDQALLVPRSISSCSPNTFFARST